MKTEKSFDVPILFIIYNRPDLTAKTFAKIREMRPKYLFIGADGPNLNKKGDMEKCQKTREIVSKIDWPCKVETRFLRNNSGCAIGVSSAISWFFSKVEMGIILEDDCLPNKSFFYFCKEMLSKYEKDNEIMMISGTNLLGKWKSKKQDYYFSRQVAIWGWATWRRAWKRYSHTLPELKNTEKLIQLKKTINNDPYYKYIIGKAKETLRGKKDSWGYRWIISCYLCNGKIITPSKNLISNLGFNSSALHTKNPFSWMANIKAHSLTFPLRHPKSRDVDREFHNKIIKKLKNPFNRLLNKLFYLISQ